MSEKIFIPSDKHEKPQFTQEMIWNNLDDDYPNKSFNAPFSYIAMVVEDGFMSEDDFFEKITPEKVLTVEEYIDHYTQTRNLEKVEITSEELRDEINKINSYVFRLRDLLRQRATLKEIHDICLEYAKATNNEQRFVPINFAEYNSSKK